MVRVRGTTSKIGNIFPRMKIVENKIFLSPYIALGDVIDKLQRMPMKNQEERDDIEERRKKAQGALMGFALTVRKKGE